MEAAAIVVMPVLREMSLREMGLPVRNLLVEREGPIVAFTTNACLT